jgi:Ca2+-binding EF-hand superfamily protein
LDLPAFEKLTVKAGLQETFSEEGRFKPLPQLFKEMDTDQNGALSLAEFLAHVTQNGEDVEKK